MSSKPRSSSATTRPGPKGKWKQVRKNSNQKGEKDVLQIYDYNHTNGERRQERSKVKSSGLQSKRCIVAERLAFQKCYSTLADGITDPGWLAVQLFSKELIGADLRREAQKEAVAERVKIEKLLSAVEDQIATNSTTNYRKFLDVLQNEPSLDHLATRMENTRCKILHPESTTTMTTHPHTCEPPTPHPSPFTSQKDSPVANYASYLRSVYTREKVPLYDKWPQVESKKYINPVLIGKQKITKKEANYLISSMVCGNIDAVSMKPMKMDISQITQLLDGSQPKCILVEGAPGIGKSTFAWNLCHKWGEGKLLQQYQLVVLLRLREKSVQAAKNISDLFQYGDPQFQQAAVEEIKRTRGERVFLLFEAYDELPEALRTSSSIFLDVITERKLDKATVLITSRPWASEFLLRECKKHISQRVEIMGFTEDDIQSYLESIKANEPSLVASLKKLISRCPHINSLMYSPLNCAIVVDVYRKDDCLVVKTVTELYFSLVRSLLLRYLFDHPLHRKKKWRLLNFSDLPSDVYEQLCEVSRMAYEGLFHKKQVIFSDLPEDFETLGLMHYASELYSDEGVAVSYSFLHLTVQEYLAAFYLSLQPVDEQIEHVEKYGRASNQHLHYDIGKKSVKKPGSEDKRVVTSNSVCHDDSVRSNDSCSQLSTSSDDEDIKIVHRKRGPRIFDSSSDCEHTEDENDSNGSSDAERERDIYDFSSIGDGEPEDNRMEYGVYKKSVEKSSSDYHPQPSDTSSDEEIENNTEDHESEDESIKVVYHEHKRTGWNFDSSSDGEDCSVSYDKDSMDTLTASSPSDDAYAVSDRNTDESYEPGDSESGNSKGGDSESGDNKSGNSEGGDSESGNSEGGDSESGNSEGEDSESGDSEGGDSESGDNKSGNSEGGDSESGNSEGGDSESGDSKGGDSESGNSEGGDSESGNSEGGDSESGNSKGGDSESGDNKSGDSESGDNSMEYESGDAVESVNEESDDAENDAENDDSMKEECSNHFVAFLCGLSKFSESLVKVYNGSKNGNVLTRDSLRLLFETQEFTEIPGSSNIKFYDPVHDVTRSDCFALGCCLARSKFSWKVDLRSCNIGDKGVEKIVQGIRTVEDNTQLTGSISEINLSNNDITHKGMKHLLNIPKCLIRKLKTLNVSHNEQDPQFYEALSKVLSETPYLKTFKLNGISNPTSMMRGDVICSEFLKSLTALHSLEDLNLVWTGIGEDLKECQDLSELLSPPTSLRKLCLSYLPCESVELIINQVDGNTTLESLYMADSYFSSEVVISLASALKRNHTLVDLNLRRCSIDSDGACQIASALYTNDTLQKLWLESNSIESVAAAEFAKMLRKNKSLKELNLQRRHNLIGEEGTQKLMDSLKHNTSLEKLYLPWRYKPQKLPAWCRSRVVFRSAKHYTTL